ncbi:MAG: nucleoside transporter [Verrucomicrobia bacterium]|nr:MAG: nucleoside transporter [Verrucomicrobiota bacterium]
MFKELESLSPNITPGRNERLGVVFHHSILSFGETIATMSKRENIVSYHCLIDADGTRCQLALDDTIAHHAGVSVFKGREGCNRFMLGCSFAGDTYKEPLTDAQLKSMLEWLEPRWTRYGWSIEWMTDHRTVAPDRKDDLKPEEWSRVHAAIAKRFGA